MAKMFSRIVQNWVNCGNLVLDEGAGQEVLNRVEHALGLSLPSHMKEVYRIHNGQQNPYRACKYDFDYIIQNSGIDTSKLCFAKREKFGNVFVSIPMLLDLETGMECTFWLREYFNRRSRNSRFRKKVGRNMEAECGYAHAREVINSSIAFAGISFYSTRQLLLLNCNTCKVCLWEHPSCLIHIPTKCKYEWLDPWLEGYSGFDANGNPCQLPLSWYFRQDGDRMIPLHEKRSVKGRKSVKIYSFATREINDQTQSPLGVYGTCRWPTQCAIASKISKPVVCHVFTSFEPFDYLPCANSELVRLCSSVLFRNLKSNNSFAENMGQAYLQEMIMEEKKLKKESSHAKRYFALKGQLRKFILMKQSLEKRKNYRRSLSQQLSRYEK
eukprot:g7212.t2